jgi:uncharacterized protein YbaR (Trm112 family)
MPTLKALAFIRCPEDRSELTMADQALVDRINGAIRIGRLMNRAGRRLDEIIDGALLRADGEAFYPIIHGIPILLRDEAVEMDQL